MVSGDHHHQCPGEDSQRVLRAERHGNQLSDLGKRAGFRAL